LNFQELSMMICFMVKEYSKVIKELVPEF
jgi:hypothetical protein